MNDNIFDVISTKNDEELLITDNQNASVEGASNAYTLTTPSMFWRPNYVAQSAWIEHVPFAFWLMENLKPRKFVELGTHYGVSYFAFCQATQRLGLNTRCFAVDTWKGDEHAGIYDENVFQKVKQHNESQYSDFSRLVRSTFDDALSHFEDGTIDLLHIDGLHSLEAVSHDFFSWLPKLSENAVVIMHDTNVRERGFGVYKLFSQLKEEYPFFEFSHGHGLGVLGVGKSQKENLTRLYNIDLSKSIYKSICEIFGRLGKACADARNIQQLENKLATIEEKIEKKDKQLIELRDNLGKSEVKIASKTKELADVNARFSYEIEKNALERGKLTEKIISLREDKQKLHDEKSLFQEKLAEAERKLKSEEVFKLTVQEENKFLKKDISKLEVQLEDLLKSKTEINDTFKNLSLNVAESLKDVVRFGEELGGRYQEEVRLLRNKNEDLLLLNQRHAELISEQRNEIHELKLSLLKSTADSDSIKRLIKEKSVLEESNKKLHLSIDARFKEIADLTVLLEDKEKAIQALTKENEEIKFHSIKDQDQINYLSEELKKCNELIKGQLQELEYRSKVITDASEELDHRLSLIAQLSATVAERDSTIHSLQNQNFLYENLRAENDRMQEHIKQLYLSTSWRITSPIRYIRRIIRK